MKNTGCLLLLIFFTQLLQAQNWSEWMQQKKTQKKYLPQQIAALQVYLGYAKEGYDIASKGLTTIGKIKKGDLDLHEDFFASLKKVNPKISSSGKIAFIIAKQIQIIAASKKTIDGATQSETFTAEEVSHCKQVFENILLSCVKTIDELIELNTAEEYTMKDDERIKRIDALYEDMQDKYAFTAAYSTEMGLLSLQRSNEKIELGSSKKIRAGL